SCTNSRLDDLRAAAHLVEGKHIAKSIKQALIVPGSRGIKAQAEKEGLDKIFTEAGFEWRDAGCSMCIGMNADVLPPHERSASTSNRNFEGRQGKDSRTHLVSPVMAAAAITGLTRCVRLSLPWRPSKLRLEVLALRSCGGRTSAFMPMHMLQPASRHSNPASVKILSRPSFSAWALMPREPGTISACLMLFAMCFPSTRCAAARKSSRRELVQEPMNTRSTGMSTMGVPGFSPMYFNALSVAFWSFRSL